MKVLFLSNELGFGGGERLFVDLMEVASRTGFDVTWSVQPDSELSKRLGHSGYPSRQMPPADITVANDFASVLRLRRKPKRLVYICHGSWQITPRMSLLLQVLNAEVWCVSSEVFATACRRSVVPSRSLGILHYGPSARVDGMSREEARTLLGIDSSSFVAVTVGRFHPVKRLGLFADAIEMTEATGLVLASTGFGTQDELGAFEDFQVRKPSPKLRLATNTDAPALLRAADIFVSTSIAESLGIAALEAMSHNLPIICTARGGVQDFLRNGWNSIWIPNASHVLIAAAINNLQVDIDLRDRLSRGAARTIRGRSPAVAWRQIREGFQ